MSYATFDMPRIGFARSGLCVAIALFAAISSGRAQEKEFELKLGGQTVKLNAGESVEITLPDGSRTTAMLVRSEFVTYQNDAFSFVHPSSIGLSRTDLGDGIIQHLMATAVGTIVIVQTYASSDPSSLKEFMLNELTRDGLAAGAKVERGEASRLVGGVKLTGIKATETLNGDVADYEVFASGDGKKGILLVTRIDPENAKQDGHLIAQFWDTLKLGN